nr:MAG TPA: hypothetical protein [Caudoviricetes sp.]
MRSQPKNFELTSYSTGRLLSSDSGLSLSESMQEVIKSCVLSKVIKNLVISLQLAVLKT